MTLLPLLLLTAAHALPCDTRIPNDITWEGVGHNSFEYAYRGQFGAVAAGSGSVRLVLRACDRDLSSARLRVWDARSRSETYLTMHKAAVSPDPDLGYLEWWLVDLPIPTTTTVLYYFFELNDGSDTDYYVDDEPIFRGGGWGEMSAGYDDSRSFQVTVYDPGFEVPGWAQGAVYYQIFPDRFRDGDPANNPSDGGGWAYGGVKNHLLDWDEALSGDCLGSDQVRAQCFYGGDLKGVTQQLPYLASLGIEALYLNPIFESHTNHRYDTVDYFAIDAELGDDTSWDSLVASAEAQGMRLVLDGVFNHVSADSPAFDLYSRWDGDGALTSPLGPGSDDNSGACESPAASTRDWFFIPAVDKAGKDADGATVTCEGDSYEAWGTYFHIPKLNPLAAGVQDLIWAKGDSSVGPYWLKRGASGWRLDVGAEIDPGVVSADNNGFWEGFRAAARAQNPDAVLIGEEWDDKSGMLLGGEYDAFMNYRFRAAVLDWMFDGCTGNGCDGTSFTDEDSASWRESGSIDALSESELGDRLLSIAEDYPPQAHRAMMNLLGSHDTARILWLLTKISNEDSDLAKQKLRMAALLQFTWPGSPMVYYGDELGVLGASVWDGSLWRDDPTSRAPMPWADEGGSPDNALRTWFQRLGRLHGRIGALKAGELEILLTDNTQRVFAFSRSTEEESVLVMLHRSNSTATVSIEVEDLWPDGTVLEDRLSGELFTVDGRHLDLELEAWTGRLLTLPADDPDTGDSTPPQDDSGDSELRESVPGPQDSEDPDYYYEGCGCRGGSAAGFLLLAALGARRRSTRATLKG